jgi:hypothetical protein
MLLLQLSSSLASLASLASKVQELNVCYKDKEVKL